MRLKTELSFLATVALLCTLAPQTDALAVMAIDLGSEYLKIAIVKPGVPMEVVLNRESQRKSPVVVAMRDGERIFSDAALNTAVKFPRKAFWYLIHLVGKKFNDPDVVQYKERFPYYTLVKDEKTGTVRLQLDDETLYSPEELLGMVLETAKDDAETFAEQPIKDTVITVPAFFNQAERRAIKRAAELVGLNVLQLMSDNAAVALNYGIFRRKEFNSSMQYYIFYDMGSTSTTATVVGYQLVKTKEGTILETNPQAVVKGVGFDRTLGGLEMTLRLRKHLGRLFNEQKKTKTDVFTNERAMGKLFKESGRLKKVLSANSDHYSQVEGLLDEKDFKAKVTRADFEELCSDLFERVTKPIEDALKVSEITLGEISEVILMGGSSRVPKVQEKLMEFLGKQELGKSINTDEAAALGAVYQAAYLSKGFRVKKFIVKEGNIYPIVVQFERHATSDTGEPTMKVVNRTLFGFMNPYPQKKVMTFNKHQKDFSFHVRYGNTENLSEENQRSIGTGEIMKVKLNGVEESFDKHNKEAESKGIKAHFRLDESGLVVLDTVESVFEKQPDPEDENKDESTWSKLGSAIGGLFGGKEGKGQEQTEGETEEGSPPGTSTNTSSKTTEDTAKKSDQTSKKQQEEVKEEETKGSEEQTKGSEEETKGSEEETKGSEEETKGSEGETKGSKKKSSESKPDQKTTKEDKQDTDKKESQDKKSDKKEDTKTKESETKDSETKGKSDKDKDKKDEKEEEKPQKPQVIVIKEEVKSKTKLLDLPEPSEDSLKEAKSRLSELRKKDQEKHLLLKAKNELEAFIYETQDKLTLDEYIQCSVKEEREKWIAKLSEAGDWQYEQEEEAGKEIFIEKLNELKKELKDLFIRVFEARERPNVVSELRSTIKQGWNFTASVLNLTKVDPDLFTQVEIDTLIKVLNETEIWLNGTVKLQEKTPLSETPVLTKDAVMEKGVAVAREIQYLITKMVSYKQKPKVKPKEKNTTDSNDTKTEKAGNKTETADEETITIPTPETKDRPKEDNSKPEEEPLQIESPEDSASPKESKQGETTDKATEDKPAEDSASQETGQSTEKPEEKSNNHDAGEL